jgi:hypothetical protein
MDVFKRCKREAAQTRVEAHACVRQNRVTGMARRLEVSTERCES